MRLRLAAARLRPQFCRMALFGPFSVVRDQIATDSRFKAALAYVAEALQSGSEARKRIEGIAVGASNKVELAGGAFAIEQVYQSKNRPDGFYESHRKYIDVQVIVAGAELMEVEDTSRLAVTQAYDPERDFMKYAHVDTASILHVRAGDVTIFFPVDGHMPGLHPAGGQVLVRKTVVKVPLE